MAPIEISLLAFVLALVGVLIGSVVQRMLPEGQLTSDSKEVIKLGMGLVATLAALVLGLLVASAKSGYDARKSEVSHWSSSIPVLRSLSRRQHDHDCAALTPTQPAGTKSGLRR